MTLEERQKEMLGEFEKLEDEFDKYEYVMYLGSRLPAMEEADRNEETKYTGCMSNIWFRVRMKEHRIEMTADSDTLIVRGLLWMVTCLLDGRTLKETEQTPITLFDELDLESVLGETRRKGMNGLIGEIIRKAKEQEYEAEF